MSRTFLLALMLLISVVAGASASADVLVITTSNRIVWPGKGTLPVVLECSGLDDLGKAGGTVLIDGFPRAITLVTEGSPAAPTGTVTARAAGRGLIISLPRSLLPAVGPMKVVVQSGNNKSGELTLYVASYRHNVMLAIGVTMAVVIACLVLWLVSVARRIIGRPKPSLLRVLLLDPDSDSFSLSKFQLYVWTFVGVFTFVYLFCIGLGIRGVAALPSIETLYAVIAGSAATSVIASGISAARGPKGAGSYTPNISELITSGGVVAADRLQFFVWTVVGAVVYLGVVMFSDPAALESAPEIPASLLLLFGASGAGYLGGKAVRGPGPVITSATVNGGGAWPATGAASVRLVGRNLALKATFELEGKPLPVGAAGGATQQAQATEEDRPDYATDLVLTIPTPPQPATAPAKLKLKLINPDGQFAEWQF